MSNRRCEKQEGDYLSYIDFGWDVENFLRENRGVSLKAIDRNSGNVIELTLNRDGQLSTRDGNNIKLLNLKRHTLELFPESVDKIKNYRDSKPVQREDRIVADLNQRRRTSSISGLVSPAEFYRNIVLGAATAAEPTYYNEAVSKEDIKEDLYPGVLSEKVGKFRVSVSGDEDKRIAANKYVLAIRKSFEDMADELAKNNKVAKTFITSGFIRKIIGLNDMLEEELTNLGFSYKFSTMQGGFYRLKVWHKIIK